MTLDGLLLASMTIQSTISPFVIDDNTHSATCAPPFIMLLYYNLCSPCHHASLLQLMIPLSSCFSSLPLWHQWQRVPHFYCFFHFQFSPTFIRFTIFYFTINHIPYSPYHHALMSSCCSCFPFHDVSFIFISTFVR